jgi:ribosomal protein S18 acetylase RimI-like enzyme
VAELAVRFPEGYGQQDLCPREQLNRPAGIFLVAGDGQGEVGCVGLRTLQPGVGEIRHMWVHKRMRRCGLGQRMLQELERHAVQLGMTSLRLGTHRSLPEAIAMYRSLGYREIPPYSDEAHNQHFFAKDVTMTPP